MSAATNAQQYQRVWGRLEAGEAVEKVAEDEGLDAYGYPGRPRTTVVLPEWWADDGNCAVETTADHGREAAEAYVAASDWEPGGWVTVRAWRVGIERDPDTGEVSETREDEEAHKIALPEPAPECERGHEHDWCSPHEILGGLAENPGVWAKGGGVVIREVCRHCGAYRVTDTWAQDMSDGKQGLTSVTYEEADEASREWVESRDNEDAA